MALNSYWMDSAKRPEYPPLGADLDVDVVIIGGGVMGLTAAYLLKKEGRTVAVLERFRCGDVNTGHTTAHLTYVTDEHLPDLVKTFGEDHARASWDAGNAAINQIQAIVDAEKIDCEFRRVPGYLHAKWKKPDKDDEKTLREAAALAVKMGFDATFLDDVPFVHRVGIRFANQAKFHPMKYLAGLMTKVQGGGSHIFENSEVAEFQDKPLAVKANGHTVRANYIIIASNVPLMGVTGLVSATLLQTKIAPYSTYAVGARAPLGTVPEACFWDTTDPYYYLRVDRRVDCDYVVFGGEDHKTGQESGGNEECFRRVEETLASFLPQAKVDHRWSGQVIESHDGLPLMGETAEHQFVATGFVGNGITFGTIGAMMGTDRALGRRNPWSDLFDISRKKLGGAWDYLKENADYPYYYLKDKLLAGEKTSPESLKPGEGKVLILDGQKVAVSRGKDGSLIKLSAVCTHMGCIVHWNQTDTTWDCPCHGSRFRRDGEVFAGPAETPLAVAPQKK